MKLTDQQCEVQHVASRLLYLECMSIQLRHAAHKLISVNRGGMIAPLLGGTLLMFDRSSPVYTSVVIFAIAGICVLMLKEDAGDGGREPGERVAMH